MKRSTRIAIASFFIVGLATAAHAAKKLAGVTLEPTKTVSGKTLKLNGAGIRTATVLKVKVYVAALYTPEPITTTEQGLNAAGPVRFDFTFVRSFPQKKVADAWRFTFKESASHTYPDLNKDVETFLAGYGPIKEFGVEAVEIEGDETRIIDDGKVTGTIKGRDFQKAFLSLWFGSKPVMPELKTALLGGGK